jgi:V/A-type H+-transporting ATPase subunit C
VARLDFANARIAARRARMLGPGGVRDLLARPTLEARLELLRAGAWGAALSPELARADDPLGAIEVALQGALRGEALRLVGEAEGRRARALLAAFLELEAARSLKAVVRGVAAGAPLDRIVASAAPTPELPSDALRALAAASTVEAVVELLEARHSPLGPALRGALPGRQKRGLLPLEVAVDRAVAWRVLHAARGPHEDARLLRAHVRDRIDARNAETLVALGGAGSGADLFVAGGRRLLEDDFVRLAAAPAAELHAGLDALFPGTAAALARPWTADRALERSLAAPLQRTARRLPLSIAVPIAYLVERRAEARRIALVLRGAALGLPGDEILDLAEA